MVAHSVRTWSGPACHRPRTAGRAGAAKYAERWNPHPFPPWSSSANVRGGPVGLLARTSSAVRNEALVCAAELLEQRLGEILAANA